MYYIGICDDDKLFCENFKNCLERVTKELNIDCNISIWYEGKTLQDYLINKNRIDLLFLDIILLESDGVSIGKFIRENLSDFELKLVYISHEPGYAMQLFETEPMDFLVKPIDINKITKIFTRFLKQKNEAGKIFTFKEEHGDAHISYDSIWYFQSMNHKIMIHTIEGQRVFYGKLTDIENIAPDYFVRIHKSYLVNENFIKRFHYDRVILRNDEKLTISKTYRDIVQTRVRQRMKLL